MASRLNPYLSFDGNAREAMEFYKEVFGGELVVMTFGEMGEQDSERASKVMHSQLETPAGYTLMAGDPPPGTSAPSGSSIAVSLSGGADDATELRGYWEKLSRDAEITCPLDKQMWGDEFGSCNDRFGVSWLVNIGQA
ncbi:MAG: VOC family protein [Actinomycetota bacterium]|nr:VOC family protein [Actinomycetota bacterium]